MKTFSFAEACTVCMYAWSRGGAARTYLLQRTPDTLLAMFLGAVAVRAAFLECSSKYRDTSLDRTAPLVSPPPWCNLYAKVAEFVSCLTSV